jgi:hypothetical protein
MILQVEQCTILSAFAFIDIVRLKLLCALATGSRATALDFPPFALIAVVEEE